jgi:CubicO group peptidase (beta-lactamase class C family)
MTTALHLVTAWPVDHVAAAVVTPDGADTIGDPERIYWLASLSKPVTAWAIMVAHEEGTVDIDAPLRLAGTPEGATLRHLLAHAGGYMFDGPPGVMRAGQRRMYSNAGIEAAAEELALAAGMPFGDYLREAVFEPLGMSHAVLRGSPAHGVHADLNDMVRFVGEMLRPRLLAPDTYAEVVTTQYPSLAGIVPEVGRFDPCPWGLGVEVRGVKAPHWTGRANSPATFGHYGGSGTMMWVDPAIDTGLVALTDRQFTEWKPEALERWPELSDAVVAERKWGR